MNLRTLRKKIKSVKNVKKITKAMQMVSAVKMKRAVQDSAQGQAYRDGIAEIVSHLQSHPTFAQLTFHRNNQIVKEKFLVVYISANKGLCGSFHTNIIKKLLDTCDLTKTDFITLGNRGTQILARYDKDIIADYSANNPITKAGAILEQVIQMFQDGKYSTISILSTRYMSPTKSEVVLEQLLPFTTIPTTHTHQQDTYQIEPNIEAFFNPLARTLLEEKIRGALLSSAAAEHSMRMLAMKTATDNATDVIYSLGLTGNKIRQTKITNELLDMITAKESVK